MYYEGYDLKQPYLLNNYNYRILMLSISQLLFLAIKIIVVYLM